MQVTIDVDAHRDRYGASLVRVRGVVMVTMITPIATLAHVTGFTTLFGVACVCACAVLSGDR